MEIPSAKHGAEYRMQPVESKPEFRQVIEGILDEKIPLNEKIKLVFGDDEGALFWRGFAQESGDIQTALAQQLVHCNLTDILLPELRKMYDQKTCQINKKTLFNLVENEAINGSVHLARSIDMFAEFISPELVNSFIASGSYDVVALVCSKPELLLVFASREEVLESVLKRARKDGYFYKIIADNLRTLFTAHGPIVKEGLFPDDAQLKEIFDARHSIPCDPYKPLGPKNQMPEYAVAAMCRHVDMFGYQRDDQSFYFDNTAFNELRPILWQGTVYEVEELFRNAEKIPELDASLVTRVMRRSKEFEELVGEFTVQFSSSPVFSNATIIENLVVQDPKWREVFYVSCAHQFDQIGRGFLLQSLAFDDSTHAIEMLGRLFIDRPWPQWLVHDYDGVSKVHIKEIIKVLTREFVVSEVVGCIKHMPPSLRTHFLDQIFWELSLENDSQNTIRPEDLDIILENCPEKFPIFLNTPCADFDAEYLGSVLERGVAMNQIFEQLYFCVTNGENGIAEVRAVCDSLPHIKPAFRDFLEKELLETAGYWIEKFGL